MTEISAREAKTHWAELLERVANGERLVITRRGKAVAMVVPPEDKTKPGLAQVVEDMLASRDSNGPRLGKGATVRDLVEEGRRF